MKKIKSVPAMGGNARAKKLSPERRSEIAKEAAAARWGDKEQETARANYETNQSVPKRVAAAFASGLPHRDQIAIAVLAGLYSDIPNSQRFAAAVMGDAMPLIEAFVRIAYGQADEVLRLRAL